MKPPPVAPDPAPAPAQPSATKAGQFKRVKTNPEMERFAVSKELESEGYQRNYEELRADGCGHDEAVVRGWTRGWSR